jgi:hypothetical protein
MAAPDENVLPENPVANGSTILIPSLRIDGSGDQWNKPEYDIWKWLTTVVPSVEINKLNDGHNLIAKSVDYDGKNRNLFLRISNASMTSIYAECGEEFKLDPNTGLINREMAAYEIAKACGMSDMVPPMASRVLDSGPAIVQMAPDRFDNFMESWAILGSSDKDRWTKASDRLRHSIYRALALDFLLGTPERLLCSFIYNKNTDRINIVDMMTSLPDPVMSANKYIVQRAAGWNREVRTGIKKSPETCPPNMLDFGRMCKSMSADNRDECLKTFTQISDGLADEIVGHLAEILIEYAVPDVCVSGFMARVAYLAADPMAILNRPFDMMNNIYAPMIRGFKPTGVAAETVLKYVNEMITNLTGIKYKFGEEFKSKTKDKG